MTIQFIIFNILGFFGFFVRLQKFHPIKEYSCKEIREIRMKAGMTQRVFASYMGVSKKTVEAWEHGTTHPSGSVWLQE